MGFKIYSSTHDLCGLLSTGISEALGQLQTESVCGVVVCGVDNEDYHQLLGKIKSAVYGSLGRKVPVTLIPQYLLPKGGFSLEIYTLEGDAQLRIGEKEGLCYGVIENGVESMLFVEGIPSTDFSASVREQSDEVFGKMECLLSSLGFEVDDVVRQWNYIGNIVAHRDGKQNYQEFNDARSHYYGKGRWQNGYPAATGIGVSSEGVIVGCIALKKSEPQARGIYPIDNPLQVAAHIYSKKVLIDDRCNAVKSTPKFERAKVVETERGACCFISGTAAIRGEESCEAQSARLQTEMTIQNIDHLVSAENLARCGCGEYEWNYAKIHVYIKHAEDYDQVRMVVEEAYPQLPVVYSVADVCRGELLVEIEGILIS